MVACPDSARYQRTDTPIERHTEQRHLRILYSTTGSIVSCTQKIEFHGTIYAKCGSLLGKDQHISDLLK